MSDKRELGDAIEELKSMLPEMQHDVDAAAVKMMVATGNVDLLREKLADAENEQTHADCLHAEAYARVEAMCFAIATLRRTYVAL